MHSGTIIAAAITMHIILFCLGLNIILPPFHYTYLCLSSILPIIVAACARVAVPDGWKLPSPMPSIKPLATDSFTLGCAHTLTVSMSLKITRPDISRSSPAFAAY